MIWIAVYRVDVFVLSKSMIEHFVSFLSVFIKKFQKVEIVVQEHVRMLISRLHFGDYWLLLKFLECAFYVIFMVIL